MPDGSTWRLTGWKRVTAWLTDLAMFWDWVASSTEADPANVRGHTPYRYYAVITESERLRQGGRPPSELLPAIQQHFSDGYAPVHPESERGKTLGRINEVAGQEAFLFAFAFLARLLSLSNSASPNQLRGATLASSPELMSITLSAAALDRPRKDLERQLIDLRDAEDALQLERQRVWDETLQQISVSGQIWAKEHGRRWVSYMRHSRRRGQHSIAKIKATDQAFTELMKLKGPVQYWKDKAKGHVIGEVVSGLGVLAFFPLAIWLIGDSFWRLGQYLLSTPTETLPPGLYFIASAGLATLAGLVLWLGRLITKLFLSQHHLRQDANERATMTTTYLALMTEGAASDVDRTIILNALFRNTSDGIIKEDGGLDPSLSAGLARLLAKP
jgi:hypothetical protein